MGILFFPLGEEYQALNYNASYFRDGLLAGRFCQQDPLGLLGGPNLYTYVGDNPVSSIDPEGTWGGLLFIVAVAALWIGAGLSWNAGPGGAANDIITRIAATTDTAERTKLAGRVQQELVKDNKLVGAILQQTVQNGVGIAGTNPITGPGVSAVNTLIKASQGDARGAILSAPGALVGPSKPVRLPLDMMRGPVSGKPPTDLDGSLLNNLGTALSNTCGAVDAGRQQ